MWVVDQIPTAGRGTGSAANGSPVGDLAPLPREPVTRTRESPPDETVSLVEAFDASIDAMADDVLEKHIIGLHRSINATQARFTRSVRALERRDIPERDHRLTTVGWLKKHCEMTAPEASGTVKTARAMDHMPTVAANAFTGTVPPRSVQLLGQARDRHPWQFRVHEPVFGDVATYLPVTDLQRVIDHWEQQVDYPGALNDVERRERRRSLYLAPLLDGLGDIKGTLTPEQFHIVNTVINAKIDPTFLDPDDRRTPAQRRADALSDICRFFLDHNRDTVTSGGEKPHITITIDYDTLTRHTQTLPDIAGMPVTPETVRRIACDAGIIAMVLGGDSEPLDVARKTRTIPTAIRRALEQRDGGCTSNSCDAPASWCDAHHIIHWADGGHTALSNLRLLCRTHHTATHKRQQPPPDP